MSLAPGTRLGPYEVLAPLGAGGMGEVYKARDPKLDRVVAVKVIPPELASNPDLVARFEREARAVAALSHPGILAIHDFGRDGPASYAVMELLEGETLRARLAGGPLPPKKAVEYAQQVAQGLAAAHEKGIVHRDLKPENIFVTRDGRVKILDFGLARRTERAEAEDDSPTAGGTDPGTLMGTVGYMSPEQVKGLPVDGRSDLFALGAVLYEMLSGERAFRRDTAPETLTAILREDPRELSATGRTVDPALEMLVRHCLEKSREERFQSARDLAYALSTLATSSSPSGAVALGSARPRAGREAASRALLASALAAGLAAGAAGAWLLRPAPAPAAPAEFEVLTWSGSDFQPTASPDGRTLAYLSTRDGAGRIWVRQRETGAEAAVTDGPDHTPRFSPDGSTVLFSRGVRGAGALYRVASLGGQARKIVGPAVHGDWLPDGREVVYTSLEYVEGTPTTFLRRVAVDGTNDREVARSVGRVLALPRVSPDGRRVAVSETPGTGMQARRLVVYPLDGGAPAVIDVTAHGALRGFDWSVDGTRLVVLAGGAPQEDASAGSLGSRSSRLLVVDPAGGEARIVLAGVDWRGEVDVLPDGSILLTTGGSRSNLREIAVGRPGDPGRWLTRGNGTDRQPTYAPDGEWILFSSNRVGNTDVWELSLRNGEVRRLTDSEAQDFDPAYMPDGRRILFSSNRTGHFEIWTAERDGSGARRLTDDGADAENATATPDGRWIVYASGHPEKRGVWKVRPDGSEATLLARGSVFLPEISPDGRLVSYLEAGAPATRLKVVALADGSPVDFGTTIAGTRPNSGRHRWQPDGRALAIQTEDAEGDLGIGLQEFAPGRDTAASRRVLTGFGADSWVETFGFSPDGARMTVSEIQETSSVVALRGVQGVGGGRPD